MDDASPTAARVRLDRQRLDLAGAFAEIVYPDTELIENRQVQIRDRRVIRADDVAAALVLARCSAGNGRYLEYAATAIRPGSIENFFIIYCATQAARAAESSQVFLNFAVFG